MPNRRMRIANKTTVMTERERKSPLQRTKNCLSVSIDEKAPQEANFKNRDLIREFLKQLTRVNNILESLSKDLEEIDCTISSRREIDAREASERRAGILFGDGDDKYHREPISKNSSIAYQLIDLKGIVTRLIDKRIADGDREEIEQIKTQQSRLKELFGKLTEMACDYEEGVAEKDKDDGDSCDGQHIDDGVTKDESENMGGEEEELITLYNNGIGFEGNRVKGAAWGQLKRSEGGGGGGGGGGGIVDRCLSKVLFLIKSINCSASPGTFWQHLIAEPTTADCLDQSKCSLAGRSQ